MLTTLSVCPVRRDTLAADESRQEDRHNHPNRLGEAKRNESLGRQLGQHDARQVFLSNNARARV